ncbi:unnamed protein product [Sphagnum balticum]
MAAARDLVSRGRSSPRPSTPQKAVLLDETWTCAIDSHLRKIRTVLDILPCGLRQQSGGNDLGEKSCTNGNSRSSRSSCNQDTLAAIPCRSFIVVGLQTGECECKVSGFQTFGDVGRTLAGSHRRDHRWMGGWVGGDCCTIGESLQGMFRLGSNI